MYRVLVYSNRINKNYKDAVVKFVDYMAELGDIDKDALYSNGEYMMQVLKIVNYNVMNMVDNLINHSGIEVVECNTDLAVKMIVENATEVEESMIYSREMRVEYLLKKLKISKKITTNSLLRYLPDDFSDISDDKLSKDIKEIVSLM